MKKGVSNETHGLKHLQINVQSMAKKQSEVGIKEANLVLRGMGPIRIM